MTKPLGTLGYGDIIEQGRGEIRLDRADALHRIMMPYYAMYTYTVYNIYGRKYPKPRATQPD